MKPIYLGIFLISISSLLLQITLTRVFSISQYYHFAFMVVSIAFLGFGASGTFLAIKKSLLEKDISKLLTVVAFLYAVSIPVSFLITQRIPFDPYRVTWDTNQLLYIGLYYLLLSTPFFLSGLCIGLVMVKMVERVDRIYFFNLLGSGLGALLIVGLSLIYTGPAVIVSASLLGLLSSVSFSIGCSKRIPAILILTTIVAVFSMSGTCGCLDITISPYKALSRELNYPNATIVATEWNPTSRVDVISSKGIRYAPGLSTEYRGVLPPQLGVTIDGNSLNAITEFHGNLTEIRFVDYTPPSAPYKLKGKEKVLVINPRGGFDVLVAIYNNASAIDVAEVNPAFISLGNKFRNFSGDIYNEDRVRVEIEEGRGFIRNSGDRYHLIVISLTDDLMTSSTGLYGMSEDYIFTVEAFEDYYTHLEDKGVLSVTRWLQYPPKEAPRVVSLAVAALENQGVMHPEKHIIVVRSLFTSTLLLQRGEFTGEEINIIKDYCRERRFDLVYYPGISDSEVNIYNRFPEPIHHQLISGVILGDRDRVYSEYLFDISPTHDDRPFFFNFFRIDKFIPLYESMGKKWEPFFEGGFLSLVVFIQALVLTTLLIVLPLYSHRKIRGRVAGKPLLLYFFFLGIGYMFIEISMIQKFILFLGHPLYSISIVITSLLISSGFGSLASGRLKTRYLKKVIPILSTVTFLYIIILPSVFHFFLGQSIWVKGFMSFILLILPGFLMGVPFPTGMRVTERFNRELIPWAWCSNLCSSVLGSIIAAIIALYLGFSFVLLMACVVYLIALASILRYL